MADDKYPFEVIKDARGIRPLCKDVEEFNKLSQDEKKQAMKKFIDKEMLEGNAGFQIQCLRYHSMIESLAGNPTSIAMIGSYYKQNRSARDESFNMLADMYQKMKEEKEAQQNEMGAGYDPNSALGII